MTDKRHGRGKPKLQMRLIQQSLGAKGLEGLRQGHCSVLAFAGAIQVQGALHLLRMSRERTHLEQVVAPRAPGLRSLGLTVPDGRMGRGGSGSGRSRGVGAGDGPEVGLFSIAT